MPVMGASRALVQAGAASASRAGRGAALNADELWGKAGQASASAPLRLSAHFGCLHRAYYAMFAAARPPSLQLGAVQELGKSHSGLIHAFNKHLVKSGRVDRELRQSLARARMNCAWSPITPWTRWTWSMSRQPWSGSYSSSPH